MIELFLWVLEGGLELGLVLSLFCEHFVDRFIVSVDDLSLVFDVSVQIRQVLDILVTGPAVLIHHDLLSFCQSVSHCLLTLNQCVRSFA